MTLSKSLYTKAIQCPKALWLYKYNKAVLSTADASMSARAETGNLVGALAQSLFADGKVVPYEANNFEAMAKLTKQYIDEGVKAIYEATFIYEGILVMVDVLKVTLEGVEIYEVKSSTSVKDIYVHDVSIQRYVLEQLGFNVKRSFVIHIDSSYVRGDELDVAGLFSFVDVSEQVDALLAEISLRLELFESYLSDSEREPNIDIGKHCNDPYECDAKAYCWKVQRNIPDYSVFNIFNLGSKKQLELYEQGIVSIDDIPDGFDMTARQAQKVDNYKSQATHIDIDAIISFVQTLSFPIYHLDFETFQQVIPLHKGISPYQQIPFQYSLHIEHEDGRLEHKEFLAVDGADPRFELAKRLVEDIPSDVTTLAYNMSFEKGVNKRLAESFPQFEAHLLSINKNMHDLMVPFQKQHYVTPDMQGSYSIKYVLPALVPEMADAYKELDGIQNGTDAMNAYPALSGMGEVEKEKMRASLLVYCQLDTLAMVRVLGKLRGVVIA